MAPVLCGKKLDTGAAYREKSRINIKILSKIRHTEYAPMYSITSYYFLTTNVFSVQDELPSPVILRNSALKFLIYETDADPVDYTGLSSYSSCLSKCPSSNNVIHIMSEMSS